VEIIYENTINTYDMNQGTQQTANFISSYAHDTHALSNCFSV